MLPCIRSATVTPPKRGAPCGRILGALRYHPRGGGAQRGRALGALRYPPGAAARGVTAPRPSTPRPLPAHSWGGAGAERAVNAPPPSRAPSSAASPDPPSRFRTRVYPPVGLEMRALGVHLVAALKVTLVDPPLLQVGGVGAGQARRGGPGEGRRDGREWRPPAGCLPRGRGWHPRAHSLSLQVLEGRRAALRGAVLAVTRHVHGVHGARVHFHCGGGKEKLLRSKGGRAGGGW